MFKNLSFHFSLISGVTTSCVSQHFADYSRAFEKPTCKLLRLFVFNYAGNLQRTECCVWHVWTPAWQL